MATNCEFVASVSAGAKKRLHSNSGAASAATIKNFTGAVKTDDLPLAGLCLECRGDVARVTARAGFGSLGLRADGCFRLISDVRILAATGRSRP